MMGVLGFICNNNDDVHDSNKMIEGSTLTTIANARLGFRMGTTSIIRRKKHFNVQSWKLPGCKYIYFELDKSCILEDMLKQKSRHSKIVIFEHPKINVLKDVQIQDESPFLVDY